VLGTIPMFEASAAKALDRTDSLPSSDLLGFTELPDESGGIEHLEYRHDERLQDLFHRLYFPPYFWLSIDTDDSSIVVHHRLRHELFLV